MKKSYSRRDFLGKAGQAVSLAAGAVWLADSAPALGASVSGRSSLGFPPGVNAELEDWLLATGRGKLDDDLFEPALRQMRVQRQKRALG